MIKAAIIGSGIGLKHYEAINNFENSKVLIICEKNLAKFNLLKKKFPNIIVVDDFKKILKYQEKINLVSIASYDEDHYSQLLYFIKKKINIIVEKPMVLKKEHLEKIIKLKKKYNVEILSNLVLRKVEIFNKIKKLINTDEVYNIEANYLWGRREKLFGWRSNTADYSLTLGAAIHMIDLVNWLIEKKPKQVFSKGNKIVTKNTIFKKNSIISYFFTYKNNLTAKITADSVCVHPHFHELKIFEKNKTIFLDINNRIIIKKKGRDYYTKKIIADYPDKKNRKKLIQGFISFLNNKKKNKNLFKFKDQIDLLKICFAADKSLAKKKEVEIIY